MLVCMAERIRIIFDADEEIRLAIKLAATKLDISVSELLCNLVRDNYGAEVQDAKKYLPKRPKLGNPAPRS